MLKLKQNEVWYSRMNVYLWLAIAIGVILRIYMATNHFTHVDDIGAINALMAKKLSGLTAEQISWGFWTYAPVQIFFSSLLVNINNSYAVNVFLGRLPSLFCGIFVLIILVVLLKKQWSENKTQEIIVLPIILCVFSWENIIYSAQMEPYEIVVLCGFLLFLLMEKKFYDNWFKTVSAIAVLTVCCYAHFQFFCLVFAMYIAIFFTNIKSKQNTLRICVAGICNLIFTIPLLLKMKETGMFGRSLNWNVGIGGRFLFKLNTCENIIEIIKYIVTYFYSNTFLIFKYFFTVTEFSVFSNAMSIFLMVLVVFGVVYVHKKKRQYAIFADVLLLLNIIMICRGTLAYGPSRHMLFVFPTFVVLVSFGMQCVLEILKNEKSLQHFINMIFMLTVSLVVCFFIAMPNEIVKRKNYISEKMINELVKEYSPDFIYAFNWTCDLYNMEIDGYANNSGVRGIDNEVGWCVRLGDSENQEKRFMLVSRTFSDKDFLNASIDSATIQSFIKKLTSNGYEDVAGKYPEYNLIYKKEILQGAETEYASDYYSNFENGLRLYIFECE